MILYCWQLLSGVEGDHKHEIMDRLFMLKYGTVSQVLLQLILAATTVKMNGSQKKKSEQENLQPFLHKTRN